MAKRASVPTRRPRERAFLVGAEIHGRRQLLTQSDSMTELGLLASTAGLDVVGTLTQKLEHPNVETFIGPGKVEELKALAEETLTDVVIFDDELSPRHQRELELALENKMLVLDRTGLILDIFAQHAHSAEGMLQVELAQLEYRLPRLTRQWTHLARQAGGGGGPHGQRRGRGVAGTGRNAAGGRSARHPHPDLPLEKGPRKGPRSSTQVSLSPQELAPSYGGYRWLHQCRQIHPAEFPGAERMPTRPISSLRRWIPRHDASNCRGETRRC